MEAETVELSVVMPCLNEAETLGACVQKALNTLARANVAGEVIVADNGSTDGSPEIAERLGARVIRVKRKGYGSTWGHCGRVWQVHRHGRRGQQLRFRSHPALSRASAGGR
jgi:glycosyltransferase involved in cell wall biosynthesis